MVDRIAEPLETAMSRLDKESVFTKFCDIKKTNQAINRFFELENAGSVMDAPERSVLEAIEFNEGFSKTVEMHRYGALIEITENMLKLNQMDVFQRQIAQLKLAAMTTKEAIGHAILEEGDTALASVPTLNNRPIIDSVGSDGELIFSTAHTWKNGGPTYQNLSSSADDLTDTALDALWSNVMRYTDNVGRPLNIMPRRLILPPELARKGWRLTLSEKEPDTDTNAYNAAMRQLQSKEFLVDKWLSSQTEWYCETDAGPMFRPKILVAWNNDVKTSPGVDRTGGRWVSLTFCFGVGCVRIMSLYKVA
jgi:hypothetical protein